MKSKTVLLLFIIGFLLSAPASAQKDSKAKEILDKTSVLLNQSGGISASFTININDAVNNIKESFEGQMFLKGAKFFFDAPEQTVYFDGKTQWVYNKSFDEVSILEPQPQDLKAMNPVLVFELYKTDCDYKYKGEKTDIQKRKVHEISLFPKNKKEEIKQVDMQINPVDNMPVFIQITYNNNMEFRIYITKYQTKLDLPDSQFVFDKSKFPNVEINDLR